MSVAMALDQGMREALQSMNGFPIMCTTGRRAIPLTSSTDVGRTWRPPAVHRGIAGTVVVPRDGTPPVATAVVPHVADVVG